MMDVFTCRAKATLLTNFTNTAREDIMFRGSLNPEAAQSSAPRSSFGLLAQSAAKQ